MKSSTSGSPVHSKVDVNVAGGAELRRAQVCLALYENSLATAGKAGENKGLTLRHDFVVRSRAGPLALDDKGRLRHTQSFPPDARWKSADTNLAVFAQHRITGEVLQALNAACRQARAALRPRRIGGWTPDFAALYRL